MNKLIITLLTLSLFSCSQKNHDSADSSLNTGSIVNGTEVQKGNWKSVVSLQSFGQSFCTGNLVNETTVYSAAHCFISGPRSEEEVVMFRNAFINASKNVLPEGEDLLTVDNETALQVLSVFFDAMAMQQAQNISINFGIGKRDGTNHKIKTSKIAKVEIAETYKRLMISGIFPEIEFTPEQRMEIGPRTAQDIAVVTLENAVTDITPIPLISDADLQDLSVGQEITLTGFGAKIDPIVMYYVYQTIQKNGELFEQETDEAKKDEIKKETNELIEFYNEAVSLAQSESDKNLVKMKITAINDKTIEVVDNKSGQEAGAFHGDSGGPAFIQLANGEWRQFAVIAQKNPLCHLGNLLMKVSAE